MNRTEHNRYNAIFLGKSYTDINAEMDRAAKAMGKNHREVGHDALGLLQLMYTFQGKYSNMEILKAFALHNILDGVSTGLGVAARNSVKNYGKKHSTIPKAVRDIKYGFTREMKKRLRL